MKYIATVTRTESKTKMIEVTSPCEVIPSKVRQMFLEIAADSEWERGEAEYEIESVAEEKE
jgi:hypothetical protein